MFYSNHIMGIHKKTNFYYTQVIMCAVSGKGFQDHTMFVQIKLLLPEMLSDHFYL